MAVALAVWSITLEGGKERTVDLPAHVRVTNISFGEDLADATARTVVKLTYSLPITPGDDDDEDEDKSPRLTTVLCALTPGKIEQASIDLILDPESEPTFQATGKNTVHLTGNYIEQSPENDQSPFGSEFGSEADSEDAYDLREVSSDVEMHPDDLDVVESDASRFEEVEEKEPSKGQKRARESDVTDTITKSKDKKTKKLKAEDGKPVVVESDAVKEDEKKTEAGKEKDGKKEKKTKKEKKKDSDTSGEKPTPAKKTIAGGVVIEDAVVGTGPMAKKGNTVRMRYVGKLTNGKEFDKNTSGKPFAFHLGKGEVIKGWDEGIVGMQAGGERRLTIPAAMAYGKKAIPGIPANSTLVFEVKLLEIK
ncbi:hypothetical protein BYT27DRAFT_7167745 [Phlegmacium glaucopus]|nr:hypothetical protein BYT27DRAFT_7167745 [Phlegmacium glaucopus]